MVMGFGEMLEEDRPPEDTWMDDERLVAHFKERQAIRDAERNKDKDDDDWGPPGTQIENEAANELLRKIGVKT